MPLSGTGAVLGAAIATAGVVTVPPGPAACVTLGTAICSWLVSNAVVGNTPPGGTMVASGTAVSGTGRISFSANETSFRNAITTAISVTDAAGLAKWLQFATALHAHIKDNARVNPTAFVAQPLGGAVTGTGTLSFASAMSPNLATQMVMVDAANIAVWGAISTGILGHLTTNTVVNTLGFTSPPGGGPLVGFSVIQ